MVAKNPSKPTKIIGTSKIGIYQFQRKYNHINVVGNVKYGCHGSYSVKMVKNPITGKLEIPAI